MYCAAVGDTFVNSSHTPLLQIAKVVWFPIRNTASSSNRGSYFRCIVEAHLLHDYSRRQGLLVAYIVILS